MSKSGRSPSSSDTMFFAKMDTQELETKRKKLVMLNHASQCTYVGSGDCPNMMYCCALKRLFQHMITCINPECHVPGCKKCRTIWKHYRKCRISTCQLCSAVPTMYSSSNLSDRFKKPASSSKKSPNQLPVDASRNSSKNYEMRAAAVEITPSVATKRASPGKENSSNRSYPRFEKVDPDVDLQKFQSPPKTLSRPPLSPRRPLWSLK